MRKILLLSSIAFMFSCSNEDVANNENQLKDDSNNLASKSGYTRAQMNEYLVIGNPEDGWYNTEKDDCSATDTEGCISFSFDMDDAGGELQMISKLKSNISNAKFIFEGDIETANGLFEPIVVEGVITDFFKLEHIYNISDETDYFKIIRNSDNKLVGVRKIKL